jgi:SAM-dependent methyltransferase
MYHACGVDVSADYVAYCVERGLDAQVGWLEYLPFEDDEFDAVVCCDVLEHVLDPTVVVAELWRVLKPGGALIVRVPDGDATQVGQPSQFGFPVHLQQFDEDSLADLLGGYSAGCVTLGDEILMARR